MNKIWRLASYLELQQTRSSGDPRPPIDVHHAWLMLSLSFQSNPRPPPPLQAPVAARRSLSPPVGPPRGGNVVPSACPIVPTAWSLSSLARVLLQVSPYPASRRLDLADRCHQTAVSILPPATFIAPPSSHFCGRHRSRTCISRRRKDGTWHTSGGSRPGQGDMR
jgi:hypothetical protein